MTNIWEASPDKPVVGLVVRLNDGRVLKVVEVKMHSGVWLSKNVPDYLRKLMPDNQENGHYTVWAVAPRPKLGGWSKSRKGWSDLCWLEMMRNYEAEVVE